MPIFINSRLLGFIATLFASATLISLVEINNVKEDIKNAKEHILHEANIHYENIMTTRAWSAHYGGVFVRSKDNLIPNPYLKEMIEESTIRTETNETLIKINPAWMTRQLSEMTKNKDFSFRITSDHPTNPINRSGDFEREAFAYLRGDSIENIYYRFDEDKQKLYYMGGLYIKESCLQCHNRAAYKIGDLRGGISITLSIEELEQMRVTLNQKSYFLLGLIWAVHILLGSFYWMQEKQKKQMNRLNQSLEDKVKSRTHELAIKNSYFKTIFNLEQNLIFTLDSQWKLIDYNRACAEFFGYSKIEKLCSEHKCMCDSFELYEQENSERVSSGLKGIALLEHMLKDPDQHHNIILKWEDKQYIFELFLRKIEHLDGEHILVVMSDVTRRQQKIELLTEASLTDPLTGIGNRMKFDIHLDHFFKTSQRYNKEFSLVLLDIDFFKKINDTYGHDRGDEIIIAITNIVTNRIRSSDIFCRWGGEEFVVLMPMTKLDEANIISEKIKEIVSTECFGEVRHVTCSFGVASYRKDDTKESLFKRLDEALYRAKRSGRNCVIAV